MKSMKKLSWLGLALVLGGSAQAQHRCHSSEYMENLINQHPEILANMEAIEAHTREVIANSSTQRSEATLYTIPVVFHVVYNGASENVPDYVLQGQLDVLNEDFSATNADISSVVSSFTSLWDDTEIQFCLASVDPNGNPTTGITRTATTRTSFSYTSDNIKRSADGGKDPWPASQYLNIWVGDISSGILGYAQFPGGPAATDGVVIDYLYVGRDAWASGPDFPFDLGRTATHEVGHWLNLRHIWGDGGCGVDDGVSDTPVSDNPNYGCALTHVSCGTLDNVQNYMDYGDDDCLVMFSAGQGTRMRATLAPGGSRASVAAAAATKCSGGTPSCDVPTGLNTTIVSAPTTATTSWSAVSGATGYNLQGRQAGGAWQDVSVGGTSRTFTIFKANRTYEWRVQANCGASGVSGYSAIQSFTMPASRLGITGSALSLFPNPANNELTVDLNSAVSGQVDLVVVDLLGRALMTQTLTVDGAATRVQLDVSNLNNGTYFVQMISNGERVVSNFTIAR
jgi:hypothetical protein